ncbi:MAG: MerR family transcriptional regulator [bacterium]|jgi:MerR family transcriptional regulator/heat shock protein HspR
MVEKILEIFFKDYPIDGSYFTIKVVSNMLNINEQTIRYYEKMGLIKPSRTSTGRRMYSLKDIAKLRIISNLSKDMGINTAGIEVIIKLLEQIEQMKQKYEEEINSLKAKLEYYNLNYGEIGLMKYKGNSIKIKEKE